MAGLGKIGTSMSAAKSMGADIDVDVKFTGDTGATSTRTSRQLSGDLEKMSAALPRKQAKVDAAEANLAKYKSEAGDAADPKVVKKLEGDVSRARTDRDKQLEKMKTKAEQRSAAATKEIDEKLASGSKKGLVGTEKGKLVDGEFTRESAKTAGEIDKKEFGKLLDQEYGKVDKSKVDEFGNPIDSKVDAEVTAGAEKVEVKQDTPVVESKTDVQPVSDDVRTELGITDNETYDSLATKVDQAVADGKLTREQADSLFDTVAEEQHFDTKEQIADLRRETAEYEQARRDNIERKELLVTQDGAKPESVKGYDEAVRQIDEKIAANNAKIAELEAGMAVKPDTPAAEIKTDGDSVISENGAAHEPDSIVPETEVKPDTPTSDDVRVDDGASNDKPDVQEVAPKVTEETSVTEVKSDTPASDDVRVDDGASNDKSDVQEVAPKVTEETPVTEVKPDTSVSDDVRVEDARTELGITDNETYDSLATKVDQALADGKLTREQGDKLFDTIAEEQHFDTKEQIADLRRETAEYEQARRDNVERKELLVTQDGAKPESVKGYDEAVRQIDEKIAANNAKIAELESGMEAKPDTHTTDDVRVDDGASNDKPEVQEVSPKVTEEDIGVPETDVKHEADSIVPENEVDVPTADDASIRPDGQTNEIKTETEVETDTRIDTDNPDDFKSKYGITDNEDYDSIMTKMDRAVDEGRISREDADSLIERVAEEQHFDAKAEISRLREENAGYEKARTENVDRKDLLVTQDGAKPESVKGYDEAVRQIDEQIKTNNAKISDLEAEINTPVARLETDNPATKLTTDSLSRDNVVEPEAVALGNAGAAAVATVGKLGGGMTTKVTDADVIVKNNGGDSTPTRTSKQLGADLEKLSAGLADKQTKLDAAKANLDKYKADMGDAADPKVVKKLEGEVAKAQTDYDKQLAKVKNKAEQRNAAAAREIDEKLDSGSKKGLVGTEKGKVVDGEFTTDSATTKGEISKKEFATEPATRDSLIKTEGADGTSEAKVAEAGQTDVNPISDDVRTELGITDNETYDSLATKVDQAVVDGKLTREQADELFYKVAEEQKFDTQERISELRRENAEYEQARIDNVERKELLVTQDGAKPESVKGYDEAVRQIDERIKTNSDEIARLETSSETVRPDSSISESRTETDVKHEADLIVPETEVVVPTADDAAVRPDDAASNEIPEVDEIAPKVTEEDIVVPETDVKHEADGTSNETIEVDEIAPKVTEEEIVVPEADDAAVRPDDGTSNETTEVDEIAPKITEEDIVVPETDVKHEADGASNETTEVDDVTVRPDGATPETRVETDDVAVRPDDAVPEPRVETDDVAVRPDDATPETRVETDDAAVRPDDAIPETRVETDDAAVRPDDATPETRVETDDVAVRPDDATPETRTETDDVAVRPDDATPETRVETDDVAVRPDDGTSNETTEVDEIAPKVTEEDITVPEADDATIRPDGATPETRVEADDVAVRPDGAIPEIRTETDVVPVGADDASVKVPTEVSGVKPIEELRFDSVQELAPITYSERLDLADDLCVHLGDDYAVGMHGIGMRSGDLDPNSVMSSIAKNGLNVKDGRTIHGTVEFFGKPGANRADVMSKINRYAYGGGDQVIVATPTTIRNSKGEMIYIGGPNTKSTVVDYRSGGYDTSSFADDCLVIDSKVPSEFVYGYFSDKPDGTVEFHPNPNHISRTGGIVSDEMFDFVQKKLRAEFNPELTKLLSAEPSPSMLASANEVYRKLEGLLADADDFSLFNNPADIRRDMETVLQYQSDCQGKIPGVDVTKQVGVDTTPVEVRTDSAVPTTEIKTDTPVEARVENAADVNVRPDETTVRTEADDAVVRTEVADDVNVRPDEAVVRTEADDAAVRTETDEQLARLTREHDAEVDRLKQKQEQEIDAATRDKNRQLAEEDARYQDEVKRLRKQYETHQDDLSLHRSESEAGVKYTEGKLKQNYEKLYDERLYDLRQQHESRMADINDRGNATIRRIDNRYSEDIRVVDKMLQDVRTEVANGDLAGSALGAKKLISDYDRFVRQQSEFEADRLAIMEKYNGQRATVESSYRGDMGALDRFHEGANAVVRKGVYEPSYFIDRAGLDGLSDRHNLQNLEIFFDDESAFVRRLYEGDANYVLQTKDARLAAIDAKMDQELRDLELRYKESSGMDVTDPYKKYEMAMETDGLPPERLKALSEELKMDEMIADLSDDTAAVQRIRELREGIDAKIGSVEAAVPRGEYDDTGFVEQPVRVDNSDKGIDTTPSSADDVVYGDSSRTEFAGVEKPTGRPPMNDNTSYTARPDGTSASHKVEADGRIIDSEYNAKRELISRTETDITGSRSTYEIASDGSKISKYYDRDGSLISTRVIKPDGSCEVHLPKSNGKTEIIPLDGQRQYQNITFDSQGTLITEGFNADGSYTRQTLDAAERNVEYIYGSEGNLVKQTEMNPGGSYREVHYDDEGNVSYQRIKDSDGKVSYYYADESVNPSTSKVEPTPVKNEISVRSETPVETEATVRTLPSERPTGRPPVNDNASYSVRTDGSLESHTVGADGRTIDSEYNAKGELISRTEKATDGSYSTFKVEPDGTKVSTNYDSDGNIISKREITTDGTCKVHLPKGEGNRFETLEVNPKGMPLGNTSFGPNGELIIERFDADGTYVRQVTEESGRVVESIYDSDGSLVRQNIMDTEGNFREVGYDKDGRITYDSSVDGTVYDISPESTPGNNINNIPNNEVVDTRPDGTSSSHKVEADGRIIDSEYNAKGELISRTEKATDGSYSTFKVESDGRSVNADYDGKGNLISKRELNTDGTSRITVPNADGKTYTSSTLDSKGKLTEKVWTDTNGTIRTEKYNSDGSYTRHTLEENGTTRDYVYDSDGKLARRTEVKTDGTSREVHFDKNGNIKHDTVTRSDGSSVVKINYDNGTLTTSYDAGGNVVRAVETNVDGTVKTTDFDGKGNYEKTVVDAGGKVKEKMWTTGGTTSTQSFNTDGSSTLRVDRKDGTFDITKLDSKGNMTEQSVKLKDGTLHSTTYNADGTKRERIYHPDNTVTARRTNSDGSTVVTKFDSSKNMVERVETSANGTTTKQTFNTDGTKRTTIKDKEGYVKDYIYNKDGKVMSSHEGNPDGTFKNNKYDSTGNLIESVSTSKNGSYTIERYNSDGSYTRHVTEANKVTIDSTYDKSGNLVSRTTKHIDGTVFKYELASNGIKKDSVYGSNNKLIRQTVSEPNGITYVGVQRRDGVFETTKYAADTRVMQEVLEFPNGSRVETNYNTDGTLLVRTNNPDSTFDTKKIDANGRTIERQWSSTDGTVRTQRPNSDGTQSRHTVAADGKIRDSILDREGYLVSQTEIRPDGSKQTFIRNSDGSTKITEYRTDGTTKVIDKFTNGSSRTTDRRADGSVKVTERFVDGSSRINEKYADGTSKITEKKADGTYSSTRLDGRGRIIEESWSDTKGTVRTQKSNGDGTFSRHTVEASGRVRDSVLDKFDNLIRQTEYRTDGTRMEYVRNADGTYMKTYLDKYGHRTSREFTDKYGTIRTERFNSDGTVSRHTVKNDGTVSDTTFDRNGNVAHRVEKTPDGTTITTTRSSNGGRVVTEKYADGSTLRKTYDANNRLVNQDVINPRGAVDHRTYNNPPDVRHRQQGQQPQADNKKSFMDRLRRQQPQVQQQVPKFRNAQEVISSLSNPLNETNLQKIAQRLNDGQNVRPYEKIVTLNTNTPKTPPSLQAVGEFHSRFGIDRSKGYDTYYNSKGTRIHHQGEYFDHITSRGFNTGDVTDRLYLNIADYSQSYKFCELFAAECERRGIPYYFKTASAVDGNRLQPMQLKRDESIVIYSGKKYLGEYTNIASEIVSKYGFKLEDPPILTGKLKNNIGYGAEPNIDNESFNSIRSKIIDSSVSTLNAEYRRRGLSINSSSYVRDLMKLIIERGRQCGIDMNNFCLNVE